MQLPQRRQVSQLDPYLLCCSFLACVIRIIRVYATEVQNLQPKACVAASPQAQAYRVDAAALQSHASDCVKRVAADRVRKPYRVLNNKLQQLLALEDRYGFAVGETAGLQNGKHVAVLKCCHLHRSPYQESYS